MTSHGFLLLLGRAWGQIGDGKKEKRAGKIFLWLWAG